jgi:hypothetical protein
LSKFEINRITIKLIRAILRFHFSFRPPKLSPNNIQILFGDSLEGQKEKRNLRIALINSTVMRFISNFDRSFYSWVLLKSKEKDSSCKIDRFMATYTSKLIFEPHSSNFENQYNFWRCSNDSKIIFWFLYWFQIFKDQCGVFRPSL